MLPLTHSLVYAWHVLHHMLINVATVLAAASGFHPLRMMLLILVVVVIDRLLVFCEVTCHLVDIGDHFTFWESFVSSGLSFLVYFAISDLSLCQVASQTDPCGR